MSITSGFQNLGKVIGSAYKNFVQSGHLGAQRLGQVVSNLFGAGTNVSQGSSHSAEDYQFSQNLALQQQAQDFNAQQAQIEREWQERMSNSAYQRAAADLEAAGLNRWLALGNPATSSAGAVATSGANSVGMGDTASDKQRARASTIFAYAQVINAVMSGAKGIISMIGNG